VKRTLLNWFINYFDSIKQFVSMYRVSYCIANIVQSYISNNQSVGREQCWRVGPGAVATVDQ
jgi:hypothetical protein